MANNYELVPEHLKALLRLMVYAQDHGYPLGEELEKERYSISFIASLGHVLDIERRRMVHEGLNVYDPPKDPDKNFMIGLEPYPYKKE